MKLELQKSNNSKSPLLHLLVMNMTQEHADKKVHEPLVVIGEINGTDENLSLVNKVVRIFNGASDLTLEGLPDSEDVNIFLKMVRGTLNLETTTQLMEGYAIVDTDKDKFVIDTDSLVLIFEDKQSANNSALAMIQERIDIIEDVEDLQVNLKVYRCARYHDGIVAAFDDSGDTVLTYQEEND